MQRRRPANGTEASGAQCASAIMKRYQALLHLLFLTLQQEAVRRDLLRVIHAHKTRFHHPTWLRMARVLPTAMQLLVIRMQKRLCSALEYHGLKWEKTSN